MAFSTGLLLKVLAGLGATAGAVTGGVFLFKKGEEAPAKPEPKPSFEERLKAQIPDLVTGENQLCNKVSSSDQGKNKDPAKYTCNAQTKGTELKEKLKFTTDGSNELKVKEELAGQKIELKESGETNIFPHGIMLVLENVGSAITLQEKNGTTDIKTFKQKTFPEFKLENGKFKHAWTIENLGEMVNLDCKEENDQKTCTLKSGKTINVWEREENSGEGRSEIQGRVEDVTFEGSLKYEEDVEGHSQGFKLTVTNDTPLKKGGSEITGAGVTKISGTTNSYEIKYQESLGKWYLSKHQ